MKERIKQLMESQHLSQKAFAQFTGISEGTLSGVLNDRTRPTLQIVESIHNHFPNVSLEWLLYGIGPMEKPADGAKAEDGSDDRQGEATVGSTASAARSPSPALFDMQTVQQSSAGRQGVATQQKEIVKYIDKPQRKITEIRVFFDDQTWESFVPKH